MLSFPQRDLAGKSGSLKIEISIDKNPDADPYFYDNFGLQVSVSCTAG